MDAPPDPLALSLDVVGDRWTLLIVEALMAGPQRFGELQRAIPGLAPNILTQRLRHLERHRLVVVQPYSQRPPRMSYELSAAGQELADPLRALAAWGARHLTAEEDGPRHAVCGTPLQVRWWCPHCRRALEDHEEAATDELHFA